jgi:hypothetical protein
MASLCKPEDLATTFARHVADLRLFLESRGLGYGEAKDIGAAAERLETDAAFREEMASVLRAIIYRERDVLAPIELFELVAAAIGGEREQGEEEIHEPLRKLLAYVKEVCRSRWAARERAATEAVAAEEGGTSGLQADGSAGTAKGRPGDEEDGLGAETEGAAEPAVAREMRPTSPIFYRAQMVSEGRAAEWLTEAERAGAQPAAAEAAVRADAGGEAEEVVEEPAVTAKVVAAEEVAEVATAVEVVAAAEVAEVATAVEVVAAAEVAEVATAVEVVAAPEVAEVATAVEAQELVVVPVVEEATALPVTEESIAKTVRERGADYGIVHEEPVGLAMPPSRLWLWVGGLCVVPVVVGAAVFLSDGGSSGARRVQETVAASPVRGAKPDPTVSRSAYAQAVAMIAAAERRGRGDEGAETSGTAAPVDSAEPAAAEPVAAVSAPRRAVAPAPTPAAVSAPVVEASPVPAAAVAVAASGPEAISASAPAISAPAPVERRDVAEGFVRPATGPIRDVRAMGVPSAAMADRLIYAPKAKYPELARLTHVQGRVTVKAVVAPDGSVVEATALSGHYLLRGAAERAVFERRYRPYVLDEEPREVATQVTVDFRLHHRARGR